MGTEEVPETVVAEGAEASRTIVAETVVAEGRKATPETVVAEGRKATPETVVAETVVAEERPNTVVAE